MYEFSTELKKEEVKIDGADYVLCEMTAAARSVYLRRLNQTMEVKLHGTGEKDSTGKEVFRKEVKITDLNGAQKELLTSCLFRLSPDGAKVPVTSKMVDAWGSKMVEELAKIASDLNGLEQPESVLEEAAEKN